MLLSKGLCSKEFERKKRQYPTSMSVELENSHDSEILFLSCSSV